MNNLYVVCRLMGLMEREAGKIGLRWRGDGKVDFIGNYHLQYSLGGRITGIGDHEVQYACGKVSRVGDVEVKYAEWDSMISLKTSQNLREYFFPELAHKVL